MGIFRKSGKPGNTANGRRAASVPPPAPLRNERTRNERIRNDKVRTEPPDEGAAGGGEPVRRGIRLLLGAAKIVAALGIAGVTIWAGGLAYRHATTSPYFGLETVRIEGASRLSEEEVIRVGRLDPGTNLFSIDVEDVALRLGSHPWIASAEVRRKLPDSVFVRLEERRAEMLVLFDVPYLVDDSGEIFKRWVPTDPIVTPLLTGLTREQLAADEEGVTETVRDAISMAKRYREAGLEGRATLSEIHREVDGGFSMTLGDEPFYVRFGIGPYRTKLARLSTLLARMRRDGESPSVIYFDNEVRPDRVTVKVKPKAEDKASVELSAAR